MNKKIILIIACVALLAVIGVGAVFYNVLAADYVENNTNIQTEPVETENETKAPSEPAPDFTVVDRNGNSVKLSDMRGKPVVLNFWASWCGPCKSEMPDFQKAYEEYGEDINFMMVNLTDASEPIEKASDFIDSSGYSFPVYFDTNSEGAIAYGTTSIPVTYFIDENGYLVAYGRGALSESSLMKGINMLTDQ